MRSSLSSFFVPSLWTILELVVLWKIAYLLESVNVICGLLIVNDDDDDDDDDDDGNGDDSGSITTN